MAFLPNCAEDILDARARLARLELWRCEDTLEPALTRAREDERATRAHHLYLPQRFVDVTPQPRRVSMW